MTGERGSLTEAGGAHRRTLARLSFLARIAVAALLIGLIVQRLGGSGALLEGLGELSAAALVAALAANTADRLLMTWKWIRLLRVRGYDLPLGQGIRIYCASMVWGLFLPATMGADAIRAVSTVRNGIPTSEVVASILIERALGLMASLVVGMLGLLVVSVLGDLPPALAPLWWLGGLLLAGGVVALVVSFSDRAYEWIYRRLLARFSRQRLVRRLRDLHETYRAFRGHPRELWTFWWLSVLEQLGPFIPLWILAIDLGASVSPVYLAGAVALAFLVARIPVSFGGLGVMEGSLVLLLSLVGVPGPLALTVALVGRVVDVASWLPWWLSFVLQRGSARRPRTAP